jgi:hypothetical protein
VALPSLLLVAHFTANNTMPDEPVNLQEEIAKAQLRKLELEIDSLEHDAHTKASKAEPERQKLELEILSLKRQNSLLSRLSQVATVFTILATVITASATAWGFYTAYDKYFTDREHEMDLKTKEARDRASTQYRTELQQLLGFPNDPHQTIPTAVFLLHDLHDVIETGYDGADREARRNEVGFLLAQLTRSPEFDLSVNRNAEYDRKAMNYSEYYANFLIENSTENFDVISKYKDVLQQLSTKDPEFCKTLIVESDNLFTDGKRPKDASEKIQFVTLFHGYKKHVELLNKSLERQPQNEELQRKINFAFCWFYGTTWNTSLTKNIFGVEEGGAQNLWDSMCQ